MGSTFGENIIEWSDSIIIGTHLIHEVTSPQAFGMLRERGLLYVS